MQRQAGFEAQRVTGTETRPAGCRRRRALPTMMLRHRCGYGDLDARLARVPGAGDDALRAVPRALGDAESADGCRRGPDTDASWPAPRGPARPARHESAVMSVPPIAAITRSVFEALGMTSNTSRRRGATTR